MARYYLKPVFWNTEGYKKPSGAPARGGFPAKHGFGAEEWNNADFMSFLENGHPFRAFYIKGLRNAPVEENEGQIFLFLYASHGGVQQLVGAVGRATCIEAEKHRKERERLVQQLELQPHWQDAWQLPLVQQCHGRDRETFMKMWNDAVVVNWPSWKCPEALFFWPETPVTLNPQQITGRNNLPRMFSLHKEIRPDVALHVMESVPVHIRNDAWGRIRAEINADIPKEIAARREIAAAIEADPARAEGEGFITPEQRKAIENRAMAAATQYFSDKNFVVEDVSARERYDLLCTQNEIELHVEVKGTTTAGETIIVTYNEVEHAQAQRNRCALFVLHSITLNGQEATGGDFIVVDPWQPQQDRLKPVCYTYRLTNGVQDQND